MPRIGVLVVALAMTLLTACARTQPGPASSPTPARAVVASDQRPDTEPATREAPTPTHEEPVGLVLVIDRSGSMTGEKFEQAKKACIAAIGALKSADRVALVVFDSQARVLIELGVVSRPDLANVVSTMQPGGGTDIKPALEAAAALIPDGDDVRFRILLMSDGMAPTQGLDEVVAGLRRRSITLSAVALGEEADRDLLRNLAESGGGTFHDVSLPAELETVFVQEASDRKRSHGATTSD